MSRAAIRFTTGLGAAALLSWGAAAGAVGAPAPPELNGKANPRLTGEPDLPPADAQPPCRKEGEVPDPGDEAAKKLPACARRRPTIPGRRPGARSQAEDEREQAESSVFLAGSLTNLEGIRHTGIAAGGERADVQAREIFDGARPDAHAAQDDASARQLKEDKIPSMWRRGITGANAPVAIIDSTTGDPSLGDRKRKSVDFTGTTGDDRHGNNIAAVIHAAAPGAPLRLYRVGGDNDDIKSGTVVTAIRAAVDDGARVVNMSMAGTSSPDDPIAREVQRQSKKGVLFVTAVGNNGREGATGIGTPSVAPLAIAVGSIKPNGVMSSFSSYGTDKTIFMEHGENVAGGGSVMSGSSQAAARMTAKLTLLYDQAATAARGATPRALAAEVRDALTSTARWLRPEALPADAPVKAAALDLPKASEHLERHGAVTQL